MKTLRDGVREYLEMRRALGFKLRLAGAALYDFVSFLEQEGASYITTELALRWATGPYKCECSDLGYCDSCERMRSIREGLSDE